MREGASKTLHCIKTSSFTSSTTMSGMTSAGSVPRLVPSSIPRSRALGISHSTLSEAFQTLMIEWRLVEHSTANLSLVVIMIHITLPHLFARGWRFGS
jgi:hypothetical protein